MKNKKVLVCIIFLVLFCSVSIASASRLNRVAYIVANDVTIEDRLINTLESMGFSVDVIYSQDISRVDLSEYDFMLINNDPFSNPDAIPVNNHSALIMNTRYVDNWHWASYASQKAANQPLTAHVNNPTHFITPNFPWEIQIYDRASYNGVDIPVYYLYRFVKSPYLKTVVSTDNATIYNTYNSIIATAEPGTRLKDSYYSNVKSVFFGITENDFWTSNSENLFRNSVLWLVTDLTPPVISILAVVNVTNESAVITWDTDDNSNTTLEYGATSNLGITVKDTSYTKKHAIYLGGLKEKTNYYYNITSCNDDGYCKEDGTFTFITNDLTAPNLLSALVTNLTNSSTTISVTTNEDSYSSIYYGITALNYKTEKSSLSTQSNIYVGGLNEKSTYSYLVEMCDMFENCANSSLYQFTTLDFTPPNKPRNLRLEVINAGNNIKVKWDMPDGEQVAKYNIYISGSHEISSFDFENIDAFTTSTEYIDSSAYSAQKRFYIVRAEDAAGNEEKNENIVGKFGLELKNGYNLVSFPLVPFDAGVDKVMHQDAAYKPVSEIRRYDSISQGFDVITYDTNINKWDTTPSFNELSPMVGYFFKSNQPLSFTIVGYPTSQIVIGLNSGLNMVGLSLYESKSIADVIIQSPSNYNVTEVASRSIDSSYNIATYYPSQDSWFNPFTINPGIGYWVRANKELSLVVN